MKAGMVPVMIAAALLSACGRKADPASPDEAQAVAAPSGAAPHFRQTEKFGIVSNVVLEPVFQVPARYAAYVDQPASEVGADEYRKLGNADFDAYGKTWLKQAASVAKPDWDVIAAVVQPASVDEGNQFKKQAAADQARTAVSADPASRNVVFGWQGEILLISGPDVSSGEYYLTIQPDHRYSTVSYNDSAKHRDTLYYVPVFAGLGMTGDNRGDMQLTVKVPIERAKEIERLREGGTTLIRVYGRVTGIDRSRVPILRGDLVEAALAVDVEALEFGTRKGGAFKPFFFLDTDQLRKSKA